MEVAPTKDRAILALIFVALLFGCTKQNEFNMEDFRIAYNVYYDTATRNYEIFSMNTDGTGQKNISNRDGMDWVYYAFDGKIYFISDRDTTRGLYFLYEMDANGNGVRKISDLRLEDSFIGTRNHGKEIVVSGRISKELRHQLCLVNTENGTYRQLTNDSTAYFNSPYFSPDGNEIVVMHLPTRKNFRTEKTELWIMGSDGSGLRQLTTYPTTDTTATWQDYYAGPPVWEPSKNVISFMSRQRGNYSIFTIKPDGTGLKQITDDSMGEGYHAWSPDGAWIVYDGSDLQSKSYDIYIMHSDGTGVKKLTGDWRFEQAPVFVKSASK